MPETNSKRWEYETCRPERNETKKEAVDPAPILNDYAERGWEFVNTVDYTGGGTKFLVFRRPAATGDGRE